MMLLSSRTVRGAQERFTQIICAALIAAAGMAISVGSAVAADVQTSAREAIILDYDTGAVLFEKDADASMPPASMSKIMTAYIAFQQLRDGRLSLEDTIPISKKAWRKGGSKMFVEVGKRVKVDDILRGIIVQSGNDAAIALAEHLAGTEEAFAAEMTRTARELGMENSTFRNATGWPDPEHRMTARDLATLATKIIRNFPEFYSIYSETSFTYNEIKQGNRNPLLYKDMGADGLKTGHTEAAGYGLTASAERNGRRLILVVNGLKSARQRSRESETLMEWGFREFDNVTLFKKGEAVEHGLVWLGDQARVPLIPEQDITLTLRRSARRDMKVSVRFQEPIPAPITAGTRMATLVVEAPEMATLELPLVAGASIERLGVFGRVGAALEFLVWGGG